MVKLTEYRAINYTMNLKARRHLSHLVIVGVIDVKVVKVIINIKDIINITENISKAFVGIT
jgi:hypothetical protein